MGKLLVFTNSFEPGTDIVLSCLNDLNVSWVRVNLDRFVHDVQVRWDIRTGAGANIDIIADGLNCELGEISAVWLRKYNHNPGTRIPMTPAQHAFVRREVNAAWMGVFQTLKHKYWVSPWESQNVMKPTQLEVASRLGIRIPETLISNSPDHVRHFIRIASSGAVIVKPVKDGVISDPNVPTTMRRDSDPLVDSNLLLGGMDGQEACYTEIVRDHEISDDSISFCPAIYQELIPKKFELRITIVGTELFAAAIYSQEHEDALVDWRHVDFDTLMRMRHEPYILPESVASSLLKLMEKLGLVFGCVDMVVTPSNEYVFLEVNPGGQWGWVEGLTGMPITSAIANHFLDAVNEN